MHSKFTITLILFTIIACGGRSNQVMDADDRPGEHVRSTDTTILQSHLDKNETVAFYFSDEFQDTDPPFLLSGKDSIKKLPINAPTLIIDAYHQVPFLIYPGEKISVSVNADGLPVLEIAGEKERNNELLFFSQNFSRNNDPNLFIPDKTKLVAPKGYDIHQILQFAKGDLHKREQFFKNFTASHPVSETFAQYVHTLFKYLYIYRALAPVQTKLIYINTLPQSYLDFADSLKAAFTCDSCINNRAYRMALYRMKEYLMKRKSENFSQRYQALAATFTGEARRFLLFLHLKQNILNRPAEFESYLDSFRKEKNDMYSNYLAEKFDLEKKFATADGSKAELADIEGNRISWDSLLKKYKGNLVYIDFWASWCVPCRKALPASIKLKQQFAGRKVVFLYLSLDKDPSNWKKALKEESISPDISYIVPDADESAIVKKFNIQSIPRYVIIGKDGSVYEENATSPLETETEKILNSHL